MSSRTRGTTLIEAMAAMVVFVIGIIGVMQMNVLASQQNNVARSQTTASKIARDLADGFERLPYDHPLISNSSTVDINSDDFTSLDEPNELWKLENISAAPAARPLLGAAEAIMQSEGGGTFYEVGWRSREFITPDPITPGRLLYSRRTAIMVRYPTPGGLRQVTVWAIKFNPKEVLKDAKAREF
jgi:Tfp pilus assembly protein PilE